MSYASLRTQAERYFETHQDLDVVTIRRKPQDRETRVFYNRAQTESFGRIDATCSKVQQIIEDVLPEVDEELRERLFQRVHDEITTKFREALDGVLEQKYNMLRCLEHIQSQTDLAFERGRTLNVPATEAKRKARAEMVIEVDPVEEEEDA